MRPFLLLLFFGALCTATLQSQPFLYEDLMLEVQHADISAVDIDNDGDLDLLIIGEAPDRKLAQLFENDGSGEFTPIDSPFDSLAIATIDWGDVNGDGNLDVVMSGFSNADPAPTARLYTSDDDGNFTEDTSIELPQMAPSIGIADLNNDGWADLYVFGNFFEGKSKLYFNNGDGTFTESAQFDDYSWIDPQVTEVDYDNDGDIDLFVNGWDDINQTRFTQMFVNENGQFTGQNLGFIAKGFGSASWGDYDEDGDLDVLLNGDGHPATGEGSSDIYRLYRNDDGTFAEVTTFMTYRQISVGDGSRFADWDNDGDLDIILTGWNNDAGRQATSIFLNNGGTFTLMGGSDQLPGVSESSIEVADLDGDSDLDLVLTGYSGNEFNGPGTNLNRRVSLIIWNPTTNVNEAPTAPSGISAEVIDSDVTLAWEGSEDDTTPAGSLSYNLFVTGPDGSFLIHPLADTTTGQMLVPGLGNAQLNTSWSLQGLPDGAYTWGVQAVDFSLAASTFATGTFMVGTTATREPRAVEKQIAFPNPTTGLLNIPLEHQSDRISVSNLQGQVLQSLIAKATVELVLPRGMYILRFASPEGRVAVQKIIIK